MILKDLIINNKGRRTGVSPELLQVTLDGCVSDLPHFNVYDTTKKAIAKGEAQ